MSCRAICASSAGTASGTAVSQRGGVAVVVVDDREMKVLFDRAMDQMKHTHMDQARIILQTLINTYPDSEYIARAKLAVIKRKLGDGWADGLNYFLSRHRDTQVRVLRHFEPWMALTFSEGSIGGEIETVSLDSTSVKAHRCASGGKGGSRNRRLAARVEGATRRYTHSQMLKGALSPSC